MYHRRVIALLVASSLVSGAPPIVVVVGDVGVPSDVVHADADDVLRAAGLAPPSPTGAPDASEAIGAFEAGAALFWDRGRPKKAVAELQRGHSLLTERVAAAQRKPVLSGLWLLGQLLLQQKQPDRARAVIDLAVRIAPGTRPSFEDFNARLLALDGVAREALLGRWRTLTVAARGHDATTCRVLVDGLDRGPVGRALGPFPPGLHEVIVRCGDRSSRARTIELAEAAGVVDVDPWELSAVVVDGRITGLDDAKAAACAEALRIRAPVVVLSAAAEGRVTASIFTASEVRAPQAVAPAELAEVVASSGAPVTPTLVTRRAAWWHWALLGAGVATAGAGGGLHAHALGLRDETGTGLHDHRDRTASLEPSYIALYALGGALIATGGILAGIGEKTP